MARICKPYPSDLTDEVWSRVAPYPTLMNETARRTSMIAPRSASSPTPRDRRPAKLLNCSMSIRDTPARTPLTQPEREGAELCVVNQSDI